MPATSWSKAPAGAKCCFLCHRYVAPEKLDGRRCVDRARCHRAGAKMPGRPPRSAFA